MYVHYIFVGFTDRIIVWLAYNFFLDPEFRLAKLLGVLVFG